MAEDKERQPNNTDDELARMVAVGFEETHAEISRVHGRIDNLTDRIDKGFELTTKNFSQLLESLGNFKSEIIAAVSAIHDREIEELKIRVSRLEEKAGLRGSIV